MSWWWGRLLAWRDADSSDGEVVWYPEAERRVTARLLLGRQCSQADGYVGIIETQVHVSAQAR